jgi:hypothetical protein
MNQDDRSDLQVHRADVNLRRFQIEEPLRGGLIERQDAPPGVETDEFDQLRVGMDLFRAGRDPIDRGEPATKLFLDRDDRRRDRVALELKALEQLSALR